MNSRTTRPVSAFGWVLAVIFFPHGMFLALAGARVIGLGRGVLLAAISFASLVGFVEAMQYIIDTHNVPDSWSIVAPIIGLSVIWSVWGIVLYQIGSGKSYWSKAGRISWYLAGAAAATMIVLSVYLATMLG